MFSLCHSHYKRDKKKFADTVTFLERLPSPQKEQGEETLYRYL